MVARKIISGLEGGRCNLFWVGVSEVDLTKPSSHKPIWPSAVDKMVREPVGNKDNIMATFKSDLAEVSCLSGLA